MYRKYAFGIEASRNSFGAVVSNIFLSGCFIIDWIRRYLANDIIEYNCTFLHENNLPKKHITGKLPVFNVYVLIMNSCKTCGISCNANKVL